MRADYYVFITVGGVEVVNVRKRVVAKFDELPGAYAYDVVNVRRAGLSGKAMRVTVFNVRSHIELRTIGQRVADAIKTTVMVTSPFGNTRFDGGPQCPGI